MFSMFVVWYLFLAGMAAGAFLTATAENAAVCNDALVRPGVLGLKPAVAGFLVAAVTFPLSCVFLFCDLGNPVNVIHLLQNPFASIVSMGAWLVGLASAASVLLMALIAMNRLGRIGAAVLEVLGSLFSLGALLYTGLLLCGMPSVDMWNSWLLVLLFAASGITCGMAATNLIRFALRDSLGHAFALSTATNLSAAVEASVLVGFLLNRYLATADARAGVMRLLDGDLMAMFWGGVVLLGILVPLGIMLFRRLVGPAAPAALVLAAAACTLIGGFCLRYCIVNGAVVSQLSFGGLFQ